MKSVIPLVVDLSAGCQQAWVVRLKHEARGRGRGRGRFRIRGKVKVKVVLGIDSGLARNRVRD